MAYFTGKRKLEFLKALERTGKIKKSAKIVGIGYSTLQRHRRADKDFNWLVGISLTRYKNQDRAPLREVYLDCVEKEMGKNETNTGYPTWTER